MPQFKYLLIGGGMTTHAAAQGIRNIDPDGSTGIITSEPHPPYKRPPLSKGLWKGGSEEEIWLKTKEAAILTSRTATRIHPDKKKVTDDTGAEYTYERLLLATGGKVRKLPNNPEGVIYFRTYDDFTALRKLARSGSRAVVIGGGFIGSEIAAALASNDVSVTMIFPENGIGARVFPQKASSFLNSYYTSKQVRVLAGENISSITRQGNGHEVITASGVRIHADAVVAGIGIQPDTALAESAGLDVRNGIVVNELLQTSNQDIFAAGDVANFFGPTLQKRMRMEHEDNANVMGEIAGINMAGEKKPYHYLPFFYSDLFEIGYEAVGDVDSRLETVEDWKKEFEEGVIYYLENKQVRGVLLSNTWGQVDNARSLIQQKKEFSGPDLKGRLPA
jgi:NADPH-dependent 2,4-dienoyl-CoA reductase/sulfur reductase-like enzyme